MVVVPGVQLANERHWQLLQDHFWRSRSRSDLVDDAQTTRSRLEHTLHSETAYAWRIQDFDRRPRTSAVLHVCDTRRAWKRLLTCEGSSTCPLHNLWPKDDDACFHRAFIAMSSRPGGSTCGHCCSHWDRSNNSFRLEGRGLNVTVLAHWGWVNASMPLHTALDYHYQALILCSLATCR